MEYYGINDPILSWVQEFLTARRQRVIVNNSTSSWKMVSSGVPQGSVLGPVLFVIYINMMVEIAGLSELFLYADDLKTFEEIRGNEDIEQLQLDIDKHYNWTRYSLLRFHPDKCVAMRIISSTKKCDLNCYYNIDGVRLKVKDVEKDLGVFIDSNLSFEEHISFKVKKANSLMGLIRRSFDYIDKDVFRLLFSSIVRPHLEYVLIGTHQLFNCSVDNNAVAIKKTLHVYSIVVNN